MVLTLDRWLAGPSSGRRDLGTGRKSWPMITNKERWLYDWLDYRPYCTFTQLPLSPIRFTRVVAITTTRSMIGTPLLFAETACSGIFFCAEKKPCRFMKLEVFSLHDMYPSESKGVCR